MDNPKNLILVEQFCTFHNVTFSFVNDLQEYGLLEIITEDNHQFIEEEQLTKLEKMTRMHYDLDINIEGIEVIQNLLDKIENLQSELTLLHNKLGIYDIAE